MGIGEGCIGGTEAADPEEIELFDVRDRLVQRPSTRPGKPKSPAALGTRSIVLVGMMGAGKSTIGRRLAARLRLPFLDADTEIEAAAAHVDPGYFRDPWRAAFPRWRSAGDRAAARRRALRARHRRRRLHARGDPRPHPAPRRSRSGSRPMPTSSCAGSSAVPTGRCCRPPTRPPP